LVAFNALGARAFHARILDSKPAHAHVWLRSELEINAETLGCSYVIPPIGSYDEQVVACKGSVRFRRNRFQKRWAREGTRLPIDERRMLARFTRLPTDDDMKFVADLTVAMQAKETTSHPDALNISQKEIGLV
jgi:hypothetical protein